MQRIRDSVRDLASSPKLFLGRIDPKRREDAVKRLHAWAAMTGADLVESLAREANARKPRGRRKDAKTPWRIVEAAKYSAQGKSKYFMAKKLWPDKTQHLGAKSVGRLFDNYGSEIHAIADRLKKAPPS